MLTIHGLCNILKAMRNKKLKRFFEVILVMGIIVCVVAVIPPVTAKFVDFMAGFAAGGQIDVPFWRKFVVGWGCTAIITALAILAVWETKVGGKIFNTIINQTGKEVSDFFKKRTLLFWLGTFGFLLLCYFPVFRADSFQFTIDDLRRALSGSRDFLGFARWIDEYVGILVNTHTSFFDIAPLSQFIGVAFLALSGVCLSHVFSGGKISAIMVAASCPVMLSPWFFSNMTYRVDSPYMALSVLAGIAPFVVAKNRVAFITLSVIFNLVMCMTYQMSSGIYIIMTMAVAFCWYVRDEKSPIECLKFIGIAALSYLIPLGLYKILFIPGGSSDSYVGTQVATASGLIPTIFSNGKHYIEYIISDMGKSAITLVFPLTLLIFILSLPKKKPLKILLGILLVALSLPLSYGVMLAIPNAPTYVRAFCGVGIFLAVPQLIAISNFSVTNGKVPKTVAVVTIFFSYCFVVFGFSFGNCLSAQKEFLSHRTDLLISDLNEVCPNPQNADFSLEGDFGIAPLIRLPGRIYPVIPRSLKSNNAAGQWAYLMIFKQYDMGKFTINELEYDKRGEVHLKDANLPILKETAFYTICGEGDRFFITLRPINSP